MNKIYPEEVKNTTRLIIDTLQEDQFFENEDFHSTEFAEKYFNDFLLEKYLNDEPLILGETEEDLEKHLSIVIAGSILYELKEKGFIDSYEDEETEEVFFLTEKGKEFSKKL